MGPNTQPLKNHKTIFSISFQTKVDKNIMPHIKKNNPIHSIAYALKTRLAEDRFMNNLRWNNFFPKLPFPCCSNSAKYPAFKIKKIARLIEMLHIQGKVLIVERTSHM